MWLGRLSHYITFVDNPQWNPWAHLLGVHAAVYCALMLKELCNVLSQSLQRCITALHSRSSALHTKGPLEIGTVRELSRTVPRKHLVSCELDALPYVLNGNCCVDKGLYPIDTKKGGTNRFGSHLRTHEKSETYLQATQDLDAKCREDISRSGALAVLLELRPMRFAEDHEGIAQFAESIIKAGQTVPYGVSFNRKSYLPTKAAINTSLETMVGEWCDAFKEYLKNDLISAGGGVSIDGVTLKVQDRQFLDFTVDHFHMKKNQDAT